MASTSIIPDSFGTLAVKDKALFLTAVNVLRQKRISKEELQLILQTFELKDEKASSAIGTTREEKEKTE